MNRPDDVPEIPPETAELEISIVAVAGDAAETRELIEAYSLQLKKLNKSFEFVFVLDGPNEEAAEVLEQGRADGAPIRWLSLRQSFGETLAITAGVEQARGKVIITSPSYLQIDPYEVHGLIEEIASGADLVCSWRHPRRDPWSNRLQSNFFNILLRWLVKMPFHDLNCNFRAMRRDVMREIPIYGDQFRFLPLMALRQGYRVAERRVRHLKERGRRGFFGFGVYLRRVLDILAVLFLTKFALKPLRFFGLIGSVFSVFGTSILAYVIYDKIKWDKPIGEKPVFILGVVLIVLGAQVIGFGLVGEIIIFTQARNLREYRIERIEE
ncbi:MAG: glycosyltransferase [Planctomycetes bacterium]|nr:glycosyltransferase [Planctomycetota bacterium]